MCEFVVSPKEFISSVLKASLTFLGSLENSEWLRSKVFHCRESAGCQSFPSFLRAPSVLVTACQIVSLASLTLENICFK
jgi:hypothetical protein